MIMKENNMYGVIENKETIIPIEYKDIIYNKELEIFIVRDKFNCYGVFSYTGTTIIPTKYSYIYIMYSFIVVENFCKHYGLYNNKGVCLINEVYTKIVFTHDREELKMNDRFLISETDSILYISKHS